MANNSNAPISELKYPTDYELDTIAIVSQGLDVPLDIKSQLVELSYFEDVFNNTISGKLVLSDPVGILNRAKIHGSEFIKIRFKKSRDLNTGGTTQTNTTIERVFRIFSVANRSYDDSNNYEVYTLNFVSEEFILSEQYRISKAYAGWKISDIIVDICNYFLKIGLIDTKEIFVEGTNGTYDFILPNKKIFETINWLCTYAQSASNNPGADMLFFENSQGYHFRSLQTLFQQAPLLTYSFNPNNVSSSSDFYSIGEKLFNVIKFEILDYVDVLDGTMNGTFANRVISIDPLLRKKTVTDFSYDDYFRSSKKLNNYPLITNYKNRHNRAIYDAPPRDMDAGVLRLVSSNARQEYNAYIKDNMASNGKAIANDIAIEKYLPHRVSQIAQSNYTRIKLIVPGNTDVIAGTTIEFNLFEIVPFNDKTIRNLDPFLSGKYMISAVRHIITPISFTTVLEIVKESSIEGYTGINSNDVSWKKAVNGSQV